MTLVAETRATVIAGSLLLFASVAAPASAQQPRVAGPASASREYADQISQARAVISAFVDSVGVPGVSVAVGVGDQIIWAEGFGYADLEQGVSVRTTTRFRIGSISKPLTAAAVGLLVEQGLLDLDAPVQRYVPEFPEKRYPITTRQLAGHVAGIRHYRGVEFLSTRRYSTVLDGLEIFADDTLLFEPGTEYSYSSYGWNLISAVVEGAAGEPFLEYMREQVFAPLGMRHTVADHTDSLISQRTRFYVAGLEGGVLNAPYADNSYKWAGGGFLSTAEDLVTFALVHLGDDFLKPSTVELLWTSQRTASGEETGYGIGWSTGLDEHGRRVVSHGGGSVGGTSMLLLYPEEKVVVVTLSNMTRLRYGNVPASVAEIFLSRQ